MSVSASIIQSDSSSKTTYKSNSNSSASARDSAVSNTSELRLAKSVICMYNVCLCYLHGKICCNHCQVILQSKCTSISWDENDFWCCSLLLFFLIPFCCHKLGRLALILQLIFSLLHYPLRWTMGQCGQCRYWQSASKLCISCNWGSLSRMTWHREWHELNWWEIWERMACQHPKASVLLPRSIWSQSVHILQCH